MRTPSGYDDTDAQTDRDIYTEAKEFLKTVIDAESSNRSAAMQALTFRRGLPGDQWPQLLYQERELDGRLSITINHTNTFVSRIENAMRQQRPRIKCHPVGEGADVDKAELINGLTRHIENRSQASVAYDAAGSSALNIGWGYARLISEYIDERSFDQELRIVPILNTFTVYRDPGSILPDGSDAMRYVISEKIKRRLYRERYPQAKNAQWEAGGLGDDDLEWESQDEIRLAEYFRIVEKPEKLYKMRDGTTRLESDFSPGTLREALKDPQKHNFAMERTPDGLQPVSRPSSRRQVQWFKLNGREVIDRRDLPGRYIPIACCQGNVLDINGRRSRWGMIANMIEPARLVNYWETMKTERLALAPKAEWTAYEGVIEGHPEWHDANRKSYSVLVGKAVQGPSGETLPLPQKTQPAAVEAGMSEAMQSAYSALMAIAGMPHDPGQDAQGEVISGVALAERRALSDVTHFQYYDNQTRMIAFIGRLILDWVPVTYDTPRMQRIIGEDGVPQMVGINQTDPTAQTIKNDLSVGLYDVVMDTGPGYDTKRQEGAEILISLMKTPLGELIAQKGADLVLRGLDTAYAEQLADRLMVQAPEQLQKLMADMPERARNIILALSQSNQQLQSQLQAAQMDLKHGLTKTLHQEATKLQVEHLRDQRAEKDTATDADTHRFDTEVRSHTAIGVAEINAGAKLIDSNQDRTHEKDLARLTAEHAEQAERTN